MWTISQRLRTPFTGDGSQVQTRAGGSAPAGRNKDQNPGGSGNEGRVSDSPPGQMRTNDSSLSRPEGWTLTLRHISLRVIAIIPRGAELALFYNPPPGRLLLRVDLVGFSGFWIFQTFYFVFFWSSSRTELINMRISIQEQQRGYRGYRDHRPSATTRPWEAPGNRAVLCFGPGLDQSEVSPAGWTDVSATSRQEERPRPC